jgi:hypothetical protein
VRIDNDGGLVVGWKESVVSKEEYAPTKIFSGAPSKGGDELVLVGAVLVVVVVDGFVVVLVDGFVVVVEDLVEVVDDLEVVVDVVLVVKVPANHISSVAQDVNHIRTYCYQHQEYIGNNRHSADYNSSQKRKSMLLSNLFQITKREL